jgi:hypothetical protein
MLTWRGYEKLVDNRHYLWNINILRAQKKKAEREIHYNQLLKWDLIIRIRGWQKDHIQFTNSPVIIRYGDEIC